MNNGSLLQKAALATGVVFLLVGILGFIPGITSHYGDMTFASEGSDARLLGIFEVSILHNIVHLLFGIAGIISGRKSARAAYNFLFYGGLIYFALFIYGVVIDKNSDANFIPVNSADDVLHLILSIGMTGIALGLRSQRRSVAAHA